MFAPLFKPASALIQQALYLAKPLKLKDSSIPLEGLMHFDFRKPTRILPTGFVALILLFLGQSPLSADLWEAPASYYSGATGTGATLKSQLTAAMSAGHIQAIYGDYRDMSSVVDADLSQPGNILLVYNRASVSGTWDGGITWNREHVWPQSRQPGEANNSTKGNLGDPHALRPCNPSINSSRGDKPFGFEDTTGNHGSLGSYYFPGDADKGDVARNLFYSDTRWSSLGLSLVDSFPSSNEMGDLSSLVAWHYLDPPDEFERRRNHAIYSSSFTERDGSTTTNIYSTNNRNAYVDRPEFVWSVYVGNNDSQLYVGDGPGGDGGSSIDVNFGRVFVGDSLPAAQRVTLKRNGFDGTYYEVSTSGNATSSVEGRHNAFPVNSTGSDSTEILVGLDGSTASASRLSGVVLIDNLDVTTTPGTDGLGANDQNDVINVVLDVLDRSNGSFTADSDSNTLVHDFGTIPQGSGSATFLFKLYNLEATAGFTASLDVISGTATGDTSVLTTDFDSITALAPGSSVSVVATLDTTLAGTFSAVYEFRVFDDQTIPGATEGTALQLTLTAVVSAGGTISISKTTDNSIQIDFTGILQSSETLDNWTDLDPQPTSPYIWTLSPSEPAIFFRSRN
jgi:endonuclease I